MKKYPKSQPLHYGYVIVLCCFLIMFVIVGLVFLLTGHSGLLISLAGGFFFGWAYAGVSVQTPLLVQAVFGNRY